MYLFYKIDERERIIDVGGEWDRSAIDHASDECVSKYLIGANLFHYISGDHAKMWLRTIIKKVRFTKTPDVRSYRCDTPRSLRNFQQTVSLDNHNNIIVGHELVSEKQMPTSVRVDDKARSLLPIQRCSICNRIKKQAEWLDPFDIGQDLDLRPIHTVCPRCKIGENQSRISVPGIGFSDHRN